MCVLSYVISCFRLRSPGSETALAGLGGLHPSRPTLTFPWVLSFGISLKPTEPQQASVVHRNVQVWRLGTNYRRLLVFCIQLAVGLYLLRLQSTSHHFPALTPRIIVQNLCLHGTGTILPRQPFLEPLFTPGVFTFKKTDQGQQAH